MLSIETLQQTTTAPTTTSVDQPSSPRISFSSEFLDESNFISITPKPLHLNKGQEPEKDKEKTLKNTADFEFLYNNNTVSSHDAMLTADELFFEGKLLPFWQMQHPEKLQKISIKPEENEKKTQQQQEVIHQAKDEPRVWFVDDDPSPRPPNCTVLWKELLRLKKQRSGSTLSPSSSSSSSSSSSGSLADIAAAEEGKEGSKKPEKLQKRAKKGLERTRSATMRIRPMVNVPICSQMKTTAALPPLFPLKKGRVLDSK